jgi:hypothetical protein
MSEEVSQAVREDWDNREFTDQLKLSIGQLFEFLARFGEWSSSFVSLLYVSSFIVFEGFSALQTHIAW